MKVYTLSFPSQGDIKGYYPLFSIVLAFIADVARHVHRDTRERVPVEKGGHMSVPRDCRIKRWKRRSRPKSVARTEDERIFTGALFASGHPDDKRVEDCGDEEITKTLGADTLAEKTECAENILRLVPLDTLDA